LRILAFLSLILLCTVAPSFAIDETIQQEIENEASREREKEASEDPLAQRQTEKIDNPVLHEILPDKFSAYASVRIRYRETKDDSFFGDGGSRTGINGEWQAIPDYWLLGRLELGFNILNQLNLIFDPGAQDNSGFRENIFLRLGYVGVETPIGFLTYGKNWSTYYQIASFTDRFQGTGGSASGTFNANTDGGPSGTGRADRVWQTRIHIKQPRGLFSFYKPFTVNLQYQTGQEIPAVNDIRYMSAVGLSTILERRDNLKVGIAVNYAPIHKEDLKSVKERGLDGDDLAVLVGGQWFGNKWYAAVTFSWLDNHMMTQDGVFFDAWGSEGYGHYQLAEKVWFVGGWNYLTPQPGELQAGGYILRYGVLGVRYTFQDFKRMVYANVRFDKSVLSSTEDIRIGNVYTVGIKWDFDW
jgi:predicted porin